MVVVSQGVAVGAIVKSQVEIIGAGYERLYEIKARLEQDCQKLRDHIETEVQQVQAITGDLERLRKEYSQRREEVVISEFGRPADGAAPPREEAPAVVTGVEALVDDPSPQVQISLGAEIVGASMVTAVAFSPDGVLVAFGSNRLVRLYEPSRDDFIFEWNLEEERASDYVRSFAWGKAFLLSSWEGSSVRVFSLTDDGWEMSNTMDLEEGVELHQLALSSDGSFAAIATASAAVVVVDCGKWEVRGTGVRTGCEGPAVSVAIPKSNEVIAAGYADGKIVLWDPVEVVQLLEVAAHEGFVFSLAFSPVDATLLVSGGQDETVGVWRYDLRAVACESVHRLQGHAAMVLCVAIDRAGKWVLSGARDAAVRFSSLEGGRMLYEVRGHAGAVLCAAFNPIEDAFCTGSFDQSARLWAMQ